MSWDMKTWEAHMCFQVAHGQRIWLTGGRDLPAQAAASTQQKRPLTTVPMKSTLKRDMSAQPHVTLGYSPEAGIKINSVPNMPEGIKWKKNQKPEALWRNC